MQWRFFTRCVNLLTDLRKGQKWQKNQGECKKVAGTLVAVWDLRGGRNKKRQWSCYNSLWQCPACVWVRSPLQSGVSGWTLFIISVVSRSVRGNCTRDTGEYIVLSCLNCYIHYLITIFTSSSTCYWTVSTRLGDDPLNDIKLSCAHGSYYYSVLLLYSYQSGVFWAPVFDILTALSKL